MPSVKHNAKIVAAAKADPDAKPKTKAQLVVRFIKGITK